MDGKKKAANHSGNKLPRSKLRGIRPNLALLGKILIAAKLRGIEPVTD